MPHGEEFSNTVQIKVDGVVLPADLAPLLVGGYVDDSTNVPDMFELRFTDNASIVLTKGGFKIGAKVELSIQSTAPGGLTPLLAAEVTALEVEVGEKGIHTVVRGLDASHRLFRGTRTVAYAMMTASDIVSQVAQKAGLRTKVDSTSTTLEHTTQDGVTDWDFLRRLAAEHERVLTLNDGVLEFTTRTSAAEATGSRDSRTDPLVLEVGVSLVHLRGTVTASGQVPSVEVRGWDPKSKGHVSHTASARTSSATFDGGEAPARIATVFDAAPYVLGLPQVETQAEVTSIATSLSEHLAGGFAEIEGTARGNPQLRAGTAVKLVGVGTSFTGKFVLSSSRHDFSPDHGYRTSFTASNTSERSLYGMTNASVRDKPRVPGVVPAIVTNNNDPDSLGRVKIKLPWISDDYESTWVRTVHAGAGADRGAMVLPEVGDEVLVAFAGGDLGRPYVLGGLYNGKDKPGGAANVESGEVIRRGFVSRKGMTIELLEKSGAESVVLSTNDGQQKIVIDQTSKSIEILSEGVMTLKAKQGVEIDGGAGDVKLKGVNVTIEATSGLELSGMRAMLEGSTTVAVKGGMAELSASGPTTIKGAMVRIN